MSTKLPDDKAVTARPPNRKPAIVAVLVLLISGVAYRTLAAYYARPAESAPLPPGTLGRLPVDLADWHGSDLPMDERVVKATSSDQLLSRRYVRRDGSASVALVVSYGIRLRDLLPHRPEICYPGNGWTLRNTESSALKLPDGRSIPCQIQTFDRAGIGTDAVVVLHYYLVDGQFSEDVSLLRSKVWKTEAASHYNVQVQISARVDPLSHDKAQSVVSSFAVLSAPTIRSVFEQAGGTR